VWLGAGTIIPYLPVFLLEQAHASVSPIGLIAAAYFVGVFTGAGLAVLRPGRRSRHLGLLLDLHLRRGAPRRSRRWSSPSSCTSPRTLASRAATHPSKRPPLRALLSRPVLAIIVVVASSEFAMGGWEVVWSIWLRHLGASFRVIGLTWVAFSLPVALSFVGGRLADRHSRYALMVGGFAITGASWIVFSLTHDLTAYLVAMLIGGGAFAVAFPAKQAFLVRVSAPRWLGSIQGVEQTAMQLAALVGTLTAPLLYSVIGGYIFAFGGVVALLGIVVAAPSCAVSGACVAGRSDAPQLRRRAPAGARARLRVEYSSDAEPGALSRARRSSRTRPPGSTAGRDHRAGSPGGITGRDHRAGSPGGMAGAPLPDRTFR